MTDYKCIIWDWNGTLLNDVPLNMKILNLLLSERGLATVDSLDYYRREFGFPIIDFYRSVGFDFEREDYSLIAKRYIELFDEGYPQAEIFPDAVELLPLIKQSGTEQLIISASEQSCLLKQVDHFGLSDYFSDILGVSDVLGSSKIERAKSWMAQRDIDPKTVLFIGDTQHDADTAEAIGCDCVLVARGHNSRERLLETGRRVCDDLNFLRKAVKL